MIYMPILICTYVYINMYIYYLFTYYPILNIVYARIPTYILTDHGQQRVHRALHHQHVQPPRASRRVHCRQ